MIDDEELAQVIRSEIKAGCLPSTLFRRLLLDYEQLEKHSIGAVLQQSFSNVDGVVWNIVAHWKPNRSSEYWDTRLDISLIDELLKSGEELPWDREFIDMEWKRIQSLDNGDSN